MSTKLKEAQDKVRELYMKALSIAEAKGMPASQMQGSLDRIEPELKHWTDEVRALEFVAEQVRKFDDATYGDTTATKSVGNAPNLNLTEGQAHELFYAAKSGQRLRIDLKAATDITGTPPTLLPGYVARAHEPTRLLDHIPTTPMNGPSVEFLAHASTIGAAAMVPRGGLKPEVSLGIVPTILTARKIAVTASCPDEVLQDFSTFVGYLASELNRIIIDTENAQVLSGDGTGENLQGLLTVSGGIVRAQATDTALDTLEKAVTDLRVGPAYCDPDVIVLNPTNWSTIRRAKDTQGRYLVGDPINGSADSLWGVKVLPTTGMPAGTGLVANLQLGTQAFIRQGFILDTTNSAGDDFTHNLTRFRAEERLALGVSRPSALVRVTGLVAA